MQRKLKSVFRSSSRKKDQSSEPDENSYQSSEPSSPQSPRVNQRGASLEERRSRHSLDSSKGTSHQNGRSRPLSSVYDARRVSNPSVSGSQTTVDHAQPHASAPANDSIANDYHAYIPALSPVDDFPDDQYMTRGGDKRLMAGVSDGRHQEAVADRNIDPRRNSIDISKRKPLPATPALDPNNRNVPRKQSADNGAIGMAISPVSSGNSTGRPSDERGHGARGGLIDSALPRTEGSTSERDHWQKSGYPSRPAPTAPGNTQVGQNRRNIAGSPSDDEALQSPTAKLRVPQKMPLKSNHDHDGSQNTSLDGQDDIAKQINQLLDGVVDLRNTVDTDQDVTYAPAVTHEIIKPHQHEVIQHKIFREIHTYEYFHRIQPVYDIQVLPPRHWVPNPNGDGLTEIFADDIPMRTGEHRMWEIVQKPLMQPAVMPTFRTQAEIIEHPTTITSEGFERRETTIKYPPTLQDMTEYDGLVQPVHFDHKTGKRWLGEITMMHTLREQLGQVADPADADSLALNELDEHLPQVLEVSHVPALSPSSQKFGRRAGDERMNGGNSIRPVG